MNEKASGHGNAGPWDFLFQPRNMLKPYYSALAQLSSVPATIPASEGNAPARQTAATEREQIKISTPLVGLGPEMILNTVLEIWFQAMSKPDIVARQQIELVRDAIIAPLFGQGWLSPEKGDRRFSDDAWQDNRYYRMILQSYLAWSNSLHGFVDHSGADAQAVERMRYVVSLWVDALAPSNFLISNPVAAKRAVESGGRSIADGMQNLLADIMAKRRVPEQVDKSAFAVGKNVAITPGAVVFANDVLELIQYSATTETVLAVPQLIVPPQLNKYYLFDLSPRNSVAAHLIDQGFPVFAVSWRNPGAAERDWDVDTYVSALLEAKAAVCEITGSPEIGLVGACTGALTMAALLGYLAAIGDRSVSMATMIVAVLDSNEGAHLGVFATPEAIVASKRKSEAAGVLDGEEIGQVFSWLRPNELVWNYWVNNYLMGKPPPAFDILYWNSDATRLPARYHGQLLDIFSQDLFRKPGSMRVLGKAIDLSKVACDLYMVGGMTDHITVWKGVYRSSRLFGGKTTYVLNTSGHIQTILSPPGNPKAKYFLNADTPDNPETWLEGASAVTGSWWEHWHAWLQQRSGDRRPAGPLGSQHYPAGIPAPGSYVTQR